MFNQLENMEQWRVLKFHSQKQPTIVLKHSNTSPDSAEMLQNLLDAKLEQPINLIVVQENKEISDAITKDLAVPHNSPQVIVMSDSKALYSAEKDSLNIEELKKALRS